MRELVARTERPTVIELTSPREETKTRLEALAVNGLLATGEGDEAG